MWGRRKRYEENVKGMKKMAKKSIAWKPCEYEQIRVAGLCPIFSSSTAQVNYDIITLGGVFSFIFDTGNEVNSILYQEIYSFFKIKINLC